jgi:hypothetical protein
VQQRLNLQQFMVPHRKVSLSLSYIGSNGWRITPQLLYLSEQWLIVIIH